MSSTKVANNRPQRRREEKPSASAADPTTHHPTNKTQPQVVATRRTRSAKNNEHHPAEIKQSPGMSVAKNKSISVGTSYQVLVLPMPLGSSENIETEDKDECLWSAQFTELDDEQIIEYCKEATKNYGINLERALYILHKTGNNLKEARAQLATQKISKAIFSADDAYAFRNAHMYFGKKFDKIRQVLPHKTISALVKHYYLTKKQQNYKSFTEHDGNKSSETTDSDSDVHTQTKSEHQPICEVCKNEVRRLYTVNGLETFSGQTCKLYFKATNKHRINACALSAEEIRRPICPAEMKTIAEQFSEMARTAHKFEDPYGMDGDIQVGTSGSTICEQRIEEVKRIQKQLMIKTKGLEANLQKKAAEYNKFPNLFVEARKFVENTKMNHQNNHRARLIHTWSYREKEAALHALIRFDGDCAKVSDILTTKTSNMVKAFYTKHEAAIRKIIDDRRKAIKLEDSKKKKNSVEHEVIELD